DAQDISDLAAERDRYRAEIDQALEWQSNARDELLRLEAEREEQERLRGEIQTKAAELADAEQTADDRRKEVLDLQHAVTALAKDRDRVNAEIAASKREGEDVKTAISEAQQRAREARESAREAVAEAETAQRKEREAVAALEKAVAELETTSGSLREAAQEKNRVQAEIDLLQARQESMSQETLRVQTELAQAQADLSRARAEVAPIQDQVRERLRLEAEMKVLQDSIADLREQQKELDEIQGVRVSAARYSDLFETEPPCLSDAVFSQGELSGISEEEALQNVESNLEAQGLVFSKRVIKAFHTCLKVGDISPVTVLAGISGTGKSELPLRYAEAMGIHALPIAVQPSWSSPQDLFGFYNYLEKRYKATELARALTRMDAYNFSSDDPAFEAVRTGSRSDRMLLVLIDEMNLARVEYYFSEFLSKLEARRAVLDPNEMAARAPAEIEIEGAHRNVGNAQRLVSSGIRLWVGDNVLFTGTMNEDESTQTLSDKVLDRANVLRFGKPPDAVANLERAARVSSRYLSAATWRSWRKDASKAAPWSTKVNDQIEGMNEALSMIGRPFGWRVKAAIRKYVANYPGVDAGGTYKLAMADQLEQKVLPKLRGIDFSQSQATQALNMVEAILEDLGDEPLLDAVKECHQDSTFGTFNWRGVTR
ncbi:MAG: McrB family protein, partial [bacterium]